MTQSSLTSTVLPKLFGDNPFALIGGTGAIWVRG